MTFMNLLVNYIFLWLGLKHFFLKQKSINKNYFYTTFYLINALYIQNIKNNKEILLN